MKKLLYWFPRIFTIAALFFMAMFSMEVFEGDAPFLRKLAGLFVHNIPVLILAGILILAWKSELTGGILFILAFVVGAIFFKSFTTNPASLIVISPFLAVGLLFILYHHLYKR